MSDEPRLRDDSRNVAESDWMEGHPVEEKDVPGVAKDFLEAYVREVEGVDSFDGFTLTFRSERRPDHGHISYYLFYEKRTGAEDGMVEVVRSGVTVDWLDRAPYSSGLQRKDDPEDRLSGGSRLSRSRWGERKSG